MQDFTIQNDIDRKFFKNINKTVLKKLIKKIRNAFITDEKVDTSDLDLKSIIKYDPDETQIYISLFQDGNRYLRYGSKRKTLDITINRCIDVIKKSARYKDFDVSDNKCRILFEYIYDKSPIKLNEINTTKFNDKRFEPGINGLLLKHADKNYFFMPTDAITLNLLSFNQIVNVLLRQTPLKNQTTKISERIKIAINKKDYNFFIFKSRAFVSFKNDVLPLYRGNIMYEKFDYDTVLKIVTKSSDWLRKNMFQDGRFLYYYNCAGDDRIDHEHPGRKNEDDLYYNDLRHGGAVISLLRTYEITKDKKYLNAAKKGLKWLASVSIKHDTKWGEAYCVYYNSKVKLGGVGIPLAAMMRYRILSKDKCFDKYIKGYARHLISRVHPTGELMGYYIHPAYQNGKPLIDMSDEERKETFSFYYPGEALLGLGLFVNYFKEDKELENEVKKYSEIALDWLIDERPLKYKDLFTDLPSDAWLMQAIDEWYKIKEFRKQKYLDFAFGDAQAMMDRMYTKNDSPYIDYEGGYYYVLGDHYFPDGARSEGLIATYYLAKKAKNKEMAKKILKAAKLAAKCQFHLFNKEENSYPFKNVKKSLYSIRFKATRQWIRIDSIQHVACFFALLYMAENPVK